MPRFSYPLVFECTDCDRETAVERTDARRLHSNPDSHTAVEMVLTQRGWTRHPLEGTLFCSDCDALNEA